MPLFIRQAQAILQRPWEFVLLSAVVAFGFGWYCLVNGIAWELVFTFKFKP